MPAGRLAHLGATPDFHHGLLASSLRNNAPAVIRSTLIIILALLVAPGVIFGAPSLPRGIGIDERLEDPPALANLLDKSGPTASDLPFVVRLIVERPASDPSALASFYARLHQRIDRYAGRKLPVIIALGALPTAETERTAWGQLVRGIADRERGRVAAYQIGERTDGPVPSASEYGFLLRLTAVQIKSVDPEAFLIQGNVPSADVVWQESVYGPEVAAAIDGVAIAPPPATARSTFGALSPAALEYERAVARMQLFITKNDATAVLLATGYPLVGDATTAPRVLIDDQLANLGGKIALTTYRVNADMLAPLFRALTPVKDLFSGQVVTLDEKTAALRLRRGSTDVTATLPHRLLYNETRFATYVLYRGEETASGPLRIDLTVAGVGTPAVRDPLRGTNEPPQASRVDDQTKIRTLRVPLTNRPLLLDLNYGAEEVYALRSEATAKVLPSVDEIIFRHQQAQTAQDAAVDNYVAHVRMEQHFRVTPADPSYNVVTENRFFRDREGAEWEMLSFSMNGATWTTDVPDFPILQAEKVLSLPLDLRLSKDYTYVLEREERVGSVLCYVIRFDPRVNTQSLYRGKVWIDQERYARVKVQVVQTQLKGDVASNEETHTFKPMPAVGGVTPSLFTDLNGQQIVLMAGRNILVERQIHFTEFQINSPQFDEWRSQARRSDRVMLRETDQGLRYFVKRGNERVVSDRLTSSARAFAMGTMIDPSFDYPLPMAGLNVLDFNFLDRDMQFAMLFAGVLAFGNVQKPKVGGLPIDVNVDFFGIALKGTDSVFSPAGERRDERIRPLPFATGINVGYQFTSFQKLTGSYSFRFDAYSRDALTAPQFVMPANTATNGLGLGYEYKRRGYAISASGATFRRSTWEPWGLPGEAFDPATRSYRRFNISATKDFIFRTFHTIHVNGAYFGGQRLDRFSAYQFGMFDEARMHGVPGAAVRFGEVAMLRSAYSFNIFDQYRLDLFGDHAVGREPGARGAWQHLTGFGIGVNLRGPRNTILRGDIGKGLLPDKYRGAGSVVAQILLLKPL